MLASLVHCGCACVSSRSQCLPPWQGTSGGLPENVFFDPPPPWSAARTLGQFGYGRLTLGGGEGGKVRTLAYDFVGLHGETVDSWGINKTVAVAAAAR